MEIITAPNGEKLVALTVCGSPDLRCGGARCLQCGGFQWRAATDLELEQEGG